MCLNNKDIQTEHIKPLITFVSPQVNKKSKKTHGLMTNTTSISNHNQNTKQNVSPFRFKSSKVETQTMLQKRKRESELTVDGASSLSTFANVEKKEENTLRLILSTVEPNMKELARKMIAQIKNQQIPSDIDVISTQLTNVKSDSDNSMPKRRKIVLNNNKENNIKLN